MKKILSILIAVTVFCGCAGHTHESAEVHEEHLHAHSYTAYTHDAEFFLQHEGLEVGKKANLLLILLLLMVIMHTIPSRKTRSRRLWRLIPMTVTPSRVGQQLKTVQRLTL